MEFQFGDWLVSPEANIVSNGDAKTPLEPRVMAVLRYLCRHPGAVIPAEEILQACWGSNELGDNPVHKAITQLRRAFGDSSTEPRYIETIRKRGYRAIAPVITFAAPPATTWEGGSPFRGLEAFQENHAAIFFGRVQATAQLRELVLIQAAHGCPMALVLGPSGSGKTSLVRAGLLPQLMAGAIRSDEPIGLSSTVYLDCADLGSGTLFQALAGALIDADINGEPLFPGASADSLGQRLASDPDAVAAELRERDCLRPSVAVFVDRLEAVFRALPGEADRFMEVIDALATSNCLLMLMACRNDFYPEVMAQPVLLALKSRGGHFDVLAPDGADIAQMVRQPALAASLTFEKDEATGANLDDVLCDAARGSQDMLPLLQYTLNELYRQRDQDGVLKFDVYRRLGGIEGAVGVRAEQVVSNLSASEIAALPYVLSLLINVSDEQIAITAKRSPFVMLRNTDEKELVRVMVEARLFVSELAGDVPSFGVAHEALLRQWPRVAEWIERFRSAIQLRTRVEGQAKQWETEKRSKDLLLPKGIQVSKAADLLTLNDFSLSPLAREFIGNSLSRAKFGERIRFAVTALVTLLAVLATGLGVTARTAQRNSEAHRVEAEGLLGYMLGEFAEKLRPIGRLDLLDGISNQALTYMASTEALDETTTGLNHRAKALQVLAEVNTSRGNSKGAFDALTAARKILMLQDQSRSKDQELLKNLGNNAFWLGQHYAMAGNASQALVYSREYVSYADRLANAFPSDPESWIEQSYAYTSLGSQQLANGQIDDAVISFTRSIELKRRAQRDQPSNTKLIADLANSLSWLAKTRIAQGDPTSAIELSKEEQTLVSAIQKASPNDALWANRLANALSFRAGLERALGMDAEALAHLHESEELFNNVTKQDPSNKRWLLSQQFVQAEILSISLHNAAAKVEPRLVALKDSLDAQIVDEPKNVRLISLAFYVAETHAKFLLKSKQTSAARAILLAQIERQRPLFENNQSDPMQLAWIATFFLTLSDVEFVDHRLVEGRNACEKASSFVNKLAEKSNDYRVVLPYMRSAKCLGNAASAEVQREKLRKMAYRDTRYAHQIFSPTQKGTP